MSNEVFGTGVSVRAKVDGEYIAIGCAVSCGFNYQNEIIFKTDVNAGLYRKKRVRISDVSGNVNGVTLTLNSPTRLSVFHFLEEGVRRSEIDMQFLFEDSSGNVVNITGLFLVETIGLTGDVTAFSEFDLSLQGNGRLSITDIPEPGEVVCDEIKSDWWTTTPGASGISGPGNAGLVFAGHRVLEVDREGTQHDIVTTGIPGNRQAKYTGGSSITFDPANVFNPGETIFVAWVEDGS